MPPKKANKKAANKKQEEPPSAQSTASSSSMQPSSISSSASSFDPWSLNTRSSVAGVTTGVVLALLTLLYLRHRQYCLNQQKMAFLERQRLMADDLDTNFSISDIPAYFSVTGLACLLGLLYMCKRCTGRSKQKQEETKRIVGIIGGLLAAFVTFFVARPFIMPPPPVRPKVFSLAWFKQTDSMVTMGIPALVAGTGVAAFSFFKSGGSRSVKRKKLRRKKRRNQHGMQ